MKILQKVLLVSVFSGWAGAANSMPVTVGFDVEIFGGGSFLSVTMPSFASVPQIGPYELSLFDGVLMDFTLQSLLAPGELFAFAPGGVDQFRITGINNALMLDPLDPTAFPLGISLIDPTISTEIVSTPLIDNPGTVPEPATFALFGIGLAGLGWARRRKAYLMTSD